MTEQPSTDTLARTGPPAPGPVEQAPPTRGGWTAVTAVAALSFVLVLSEFIPIGVLPQIAGGLDVSTGRAGLLVVVPGLAAAITAPLLTVASGRLDRRHVLVALAGAAVVSNVLAAVAPNMAVMVVARIVLGAGVGGFWSLGAGVAARLVPEAAVHRASSMITGGISAATVISLPLGALISHLAGWRVAFVAAAAAALAALVLLAAVLPALRPAGGTRFADLTATWRRPAVLLAALGTALAFLGHFASYTYITPYLQERAHFGPSAVTVTLLVYGAVGVAGNFAAAWAIGRSLRVAYVGAALLVAVSVALLPPLAGFAPAVVLLVSLWGAAFNAIPLAVQTWMLRASGDSPEGGLSLLVSTLQVALATGSFAGGFLVDGFGVGSAFASTTVLLLLAALVPHAGARAGRP
ncbi:MFS transporter [Streptacidiphilus sp. ASG 303]|uniref:MFS transporter n=1 Tax=Streptacidiphilus sp. ASG 303 TaxID=2896847 RepID=UPI001E2AFCE7|nr:MFS transporter [Streptacidiphilus sp. ASG 303]MCD0484129.1 MFS transporter [Streptacidiphilus sp. ASG 303]